MNSFRDTYALVDLGKLINNLNHIHDSFQKPMYAVLKANAYGHGVGRIIDAIDSLDYIQGYCLATLYEAVEIRILGYQKDILVIGTVRNDDLKVASQSNITVTVYDKEFALAIAKCNLPIKVHIKVDTGMNRIGFTTKEQLDECISILRQNPNCDIEGIFTHYATADDNLVAQKNAYDRFLEMIKGYEFKIIHAANSATIMHIPDTTTNVGRIGIGMYGIDPSDCRVPYLEPIMSLYSKVMMVKKVNAGEYVGYNYTYQASKDEYIATMPIGYADGLIRKNKGRNVYINGKYYEIVGNICMDQAMVRVDETVKTGDSVEIFGEHISIYDMANDLETIPYEILCLLSRRVERIYKEPNEK